MIQLYSTISRITAAGAPNSKFTRLSPTHARHNPHPSSAPRRQGGEKGEVRASKRRRTRNDNTISTPTPSRAWLARTRAPCSVIYLHHRPDAGRSLATCTWRQQGNLESLETQKNYFIRPLSFPMAATVPHIYMRSLHAPRKCFSWKTTGLNG